MSRAAHVEGKGVAAESAGCGAARAKGPADGAEGWAAAGLGAVREVAEGTAGHIASEEGEGAASAAASGASAAGSVLGRVAAGGAGLSGGPGPAAGAAPAQGTHPEVPGPPRNTSPGPNSPGPSPAGPKALRARSQGGASSVGPQDPRPHQEQCPEGESSPGPEEAPPTYEEIMAPGPKTLQRHTPPGRRALGSAERHPNPNPTRKESLKTDTDMARAPSKGLPSDGEVARARGFLRRRLLVWGLAPWVRLMARCRDDWTRAGLFRDRALLTGAWGSLRGHCRAERTRKALHQARLSAVAAAPQAPEAAGGGLGKMEGRQGLPAGPGQGSQGPLLSAGPAAARFLLVARVSAGAAEEGGEAAEGRGAAGGPVLPEVLPGPLEAAPGRGALPPQGPGPRRPDLGQRADLAQQVTSSQH
eukprot:CAMPEP_0170059808 /NCGR_PEP_ID=MMETSP0019_2-20121128/1960_1 /TAXON_ID=98059 /ORGANISM="Dinobryon sp., Strain UTEXLB2267" /LENGTH=416 /DNA_ID=CAMNT_0010265177 /DNA_START=424 /DNA_END=1675 /DNA_ORIENTATION=-